MTARSRLPRRHVELFAATSILFNCITSKGWIPATSTLSAVDYGVELVSTNGASATFTVSGFGLTTR